MKTSNLLLYAIGGFAAYMILRPKKASAMAMSSDASTTSGGESGGTTEPQAPESNVIVGTFVGGVPQGSNVVSQGSGGIVPNPKIKFPFKKKPLLPKRRADLFGIEVPRVIANLPELKEKPIRTKTQYVYYANLIRLTPYEQMTPVRYKEKTLGTIYVSDIDENNNMVWRNEATGEVVNIIYPTR